MEVAIPMIALGSLYIASNQDNKETFVSRGNQHNILPNTNLPTVNYPVYKDDTAPDINNYTSPNQITDKYFDKNKPKEPPSTLRQNFVGLDGNNIGVNQFKHNNMVPYFGGKVKGNAFMDKTPDEALLDSKTGVGSMHIKKTEQAPMFSPDSNTQYTYGAPTQTDFYQSRVLPSNRINNVKPFQSEQIGPGLNQGYDSLGSGGFNSGMGSRDSWLPKTVNELRVATNPKITYDLNGHQGPVGVGGGTGNTARAPDSKSQGRVEKNRPDTYFINSPDRYFTTGGLEKGQTSRSLEIDRYVNRPSTNSDHMNPGGNDKGSRVPQHYRAPHVKQLSGLPLGGVMVNEGYNNQGRDEMDGVNNRMLTGEFTQNGIVSGVMGAVIAPLLDLVRPTRKQNVVGSIRPYGNGLTPINGGNVPVVDPNDRAPVTTKETTMYSPFGAGARAFNDDLSKGPRGANPQQPVFNQRDTTNISYKGGAGPGNSVSNTTTYNSAYNSTVNSSRSQEDRANHGSMSLLNSNINQTTHRLDSDRDTYEWASPFNSAGSATPSMHTMGRIHMPQTYENVSNERINPNLLKAFKENPYTKSLNSIA